MVIKSYRKLRKQVQRTDLNISYTYTKYSSDWIAVPVAEGLAYFILNSYIPVRAALGVILFFKKQIDWKVTELCFPFNPTKRPLNIDWYATAHHLSRHHSVTIQSIESWDFILCLLLVLWCDHKLLFWLLFVTWGFQWIW